MYSTEVAWEADSAASDLRQALEEQTRELDAVLSRFTEARLLLPTGTDHGWQGLAQLFYGWALDGLRTDLGVAHEQLRTAARETRQAAQSLGHRVG
jgi:hypothetical protein